MKRKSESRQERKMIIGAVAMLIIATLLFGLATEPGMNLMQKVKNAVMPKTSITISAANNETLKNKITEAKLVAGYNHFIALTADGKVYGWGYNGYGQLGLNNTTSYKEPTYLGIDNAIDVAAGGNYTIVLKQDGTLWATGNNENGELGINNTATQKTFVQVVDEQGTGKLSNIKSISAGANTTYAITTTGEMYGWGYNGYGQLGIGDTANRIKPTKSNLQKIKQIAANEYSTIALTEDGEIYGAGYNTEGELGLGYNQEKVLKWGKVKDPNGKDNITNATQIATGRYHIVVLTNNGKVYSAGYNNVYQLADGTTTYKNVLAPMKDNSDNEMTNIKNIYASGYCSYVLTNNNEVYAVGYNNYGQQFQNNTATNTKLTKIKTDVEITSIAVTTSQEYQAAA